MKYPFTPELLDALPEELAELFRGLELKLLEEICSRLKISGQLNEVTVQDIRALRAHGIDLGAIQRAISEATGTGADKLEALLDDVVQRNQAYYTELIDLARVTAPERLVDERDIAAIRRQTWGAYRNITGSMGFLVRQGGRLTMLEPGKAYQWALDQAALQVQSGAISYNQAISEAARQLADSGLKTVSYESGHVDSVDVAVRRAVMTGVNQLNQKYREQSADYLETDLVEVTAHLGARNIDGPNGWENHARWQGKVYRWRRDGGPKPERQIEPTPLANTGNSGIIKLNSSFVIGKSLGAKAKNYDVIDKQTGIVYRFVEGTRIKNPTVFAGYKGVKPLEQAVVDGLVAEFGGSASKWQHAKGIGILNVDGEEIEAEVHWFQEETVGKVKFKVKEWRYD